ncbi:MAG TPA: hypothetical protein VMU19_11005 [Bryobacteraceae bacterium]|nr:hypothetical protein [Bryobacteraceae bacterium]
MIEAEIPPLPPSSPHWPDLFQRQIVQSEMEGGVDLRRLPPGSVLEVQTQNRAYTIVTRGYNDVEISGHPTLCPEPIAARIHGSTWGGSLLKQHFIGRGMQMEFQISGCLPVTTTRILDVREK